MKLTPAETLILSLLADISQHLRIHNGIDPAKLHRAIQTGNAWALPILYPGILHGETVEDPVVREVGDILTVYDDLEGSWEALDKGDKLALQLKLPDIEAHIRFPGFDGNGEAEHLNVANFYVWEMGRFSRFKGRDLNSHVPLLDRYRPMVPVHQRLARGCMGATLPQAAITEIIEAR